MCTIYIYSSSGYRMRACMLYMCPHTVRMLYMCPHTVRMLYMVLILSACYMCPHIWRSLCTAAKQYTAVYCLAAVHSLHICVLMLYMCPHTMRMTARNASIFFLEGVLEEVLPLCSIQ